MVFTDGDATDKALLPKAVSMWRKRGVKIYAVGIGWFLSRRGETKEDLLDEFLSPAFFPIFDKQKYAQQTKGWTDGPTDGHTLS